MPVRMRVGTTFSGEVKSCEGEVVRREDQSVVFAGKDGAGGDLEVDRRLSRASAGVWVVFMSFFFVSSLSFGDKDELQKLGHRMTSLLPTTWPLEL